VLFTLAAIPGVSAETRVNDTWVDPNGRFWVATDSGVFVSETPNWRQLSDEATVRFYGLDAAGRFWVGQEESAAYYPLHDAEPQWQTFGAEAGWQPDVRRGRFTPDFGYGETLVTDRLGRVWLVRNGQLYHFDPATSLWTNYLAADLGFVSAIGDDDNQSRFLTDVALDSFGNIWVSHCANQGLLFTGEGVRWYNGETWAGLGQFAEQCILDIEVDSDGRVWLAGWQTVLLFDPANLRWTNIDLPPWPNPLMVIDLTLDRHQNPWLAVIKATAGNWQGSGARYHWTEAGWQSDYAEYEAIYGVDSFSGPFGGWGSDVAFSAEGNAWVCDWGTILTFSPAHNGLFSQVTSFYPEGVCQVQIDGNGRVWLAQIGRGFNLWYYDPE
jgi:streptogramin lyase